jgi:hypothetical protein
MTDWSYSGDPADSTLDQVRFISGFTDNDDQRIMDREITWLLTENGSDPYRAAVKALSFVSAKVASLADKEVGDLKITLSQQAKGYREAAKAVEKEQKNIALLRLAPYAGGISIADKDLTRADTDFPQPTAWQDQFANPPVKYASTST